MRFYTRIGPNLGISFGPIGWLFFWFLVFLGAIPFIVIGVMFVLAVFTIAIILGILLIVNGIVYHVLTGRDARVPVPGSAWGTELEYWMEDHGWIRLPQRLRRLPPMTSTEITSKLYGKKGQLKVVK